MEVKYTGDSVREYHSAGRHSPQRRRRKHSIFPIILIIILLAALITSIVLFAKVMLPAGHGSNVSGEGVSSSDGVAADGAADAQAGTVSYVSMLPTAENAYSVGTAAEPWNEWYLKIVSAKCPIDDSFKPELSVIKQDYAYYDSMKFDSRAIEALEDMIAAARKDGASLTVISAYRDVQKQDSLFQNKVNRVMQANAGLSRSEAEELAATEVTRPYTSEHHTGLDVDFNLAESSFANSKEAKWLNEHAADYGFVLRYPKEKEDITGIIYEAWHFRFVGAEHAAKMNELDICLEEYVDYLKEN